MPLVQFKEWIPKVHESVFVAPTAWVTGDTVLEENVSVFFGASLRGDILPIRVGAGSNIQEQAILHTSHDLSPCIVGENVTIGHQAIIHGCAIKDNCIIGMGSVILDGAAIGENSIVGAQALVPMNAIIPPRSLVLGVPGKVVRSISDAEVESIRASALHYVETGRQYKSHLS
ncbi:MAG: gamma carbonic anhydrase family protein [Bdellovibrionales bacterium]|nr:gamma carbonic anhydrase family protein [Bdellovibrionales bacterium]